MIKRTVEISREPCHLATRNEQLLILRRTEPPRPLPAQPPNLAGSIPIEDIGVLMVDERDTTYSHSALAKLAEHGASVVICGRDHLPVGMYLPLARNSELLSRLDAQLSASKPVRKRLWSIIVAAKIEAQAAALPPLESVEPVRKRLVTLAASVRSGDPMNAEAQAAALYWPVLFSGCESVTHPFRRRAGDLSAAPPNNLLDYGYAALRAAIARALVSAGLLPALGLRHATRDNPFCLADDLIEPLRPLVDRRARWLAQRGEIILAQPIKAELLGVLTETVESRAGKGPLMVVVARYVASLVACLRGGAKPESLDIPRVPITVNVESKEHCPDQPEGDQSGDCATDGAES